MSDRKKIRPIVYLTCGTAVTLGMAVIKLTGWVLYRAVTVFLLHE